MKSVDDNNNYKFTMNVCEYLWKLQSSLCKV